MTRETICAELRRLDFGCQAAEIEAATTPDAECAALEYALSFISGYRRALDRHARALQHTSAGSEAKEIDRLEDEIVKRHAVLSADRLRRTGT